MNSHLRGDSAITHDTVGQRSLVRAIESNAALRPQHVFIEYGALHITHAAFAAAVRRVANGLLAAGIRAGQRVLAYLPNCPEYLLVRFAVQRIGAVFVTSSTAGSHVTCATMSRIRAADSRSVMTSVAPLAASW